ncbi:MAG: NAD(P)-dependent alcohol dehydrogenase [Actinomycetota bacterium]|nr:NAD(P)-dependent alcohol dehydrogenase [Actinomycetota bacterium]
MRAVVQGIYGSPDVLELRDIDKPVVEDDDVLVRVHAAAVHPGDCLIMRGLPYVLRLMGFGVRRPRKRVPGFDVAGRVERVGKKVMQFQPGDEVFGVCKGTLAEYVSVSEDQVALKPANLTLEQAAAVPISGVVALRAVRDHGKVQRGEKVLINGASGGVGTFAVQIAKSLGAEVTGVCSTRNVEMVRSMGADHVIDYTQEDFTRSGKRYDFILDNIANHSFSELRRALTPDGTLIPNNGTSGGRWIGTLGRTIKALVMSPFVSQRLRPFLSIEKKEDLVALKELIEAGKVIPVIDRTYALSEAPDAMRHLEEGHARGKVVITI